MKKVEFTPKEVETLKEAIDRQKINIDMYARANEYGKEFKEVAIDKVRTLESIEKKLK